MGIQQKIMIEEATRCLLCDEAQCSKACKEDSDPASAIRAVAFENSECAARFVDLQKCAKCEAPCEAACIHYDRPISIRSIIAQLPSYSKSMVDLSIDFCGVHCENPFFLSSSIVAGSYEMCAKAFEMGWAGAVFKTIGFFVPKEVSPRFEEYGKEGKSFLGFKNLEQISDHPLSENLETFKKLKRDYPNKVLVASIMGQNEAEWTELARLVTEAGVDMIECNFSCPHMSADGLGSDVGQDTEQVKLYVEATRRGTHIPILAKMTPNLAHMEIPAIAAVQGGADGIAAINTIKSITSVDASICGKTAISGYSGKAVKPIALRHICDMAKCERLENIPISGMGGIETWRDALDFIQLGCANIQVTTGVMQYGYRIIEDMISGLAKYMSDHGVSRVEELVGTALERFVNAEVLDRETYVLPEFKKEMCIGCGRCIISCTDAGHQAIQMKEGKASLIGSKCVGCHLCRLVCPVDAIGTFKRVKVRG